MGDVGEQERIEREALLLFERLADCDHDPDARERLLATASPEILAVLRELEQADGPATDRFATAFIAARDRDSAAPPERIGPYRLTGRIGAGGMGEVWRGERDDGLFEQTVAIKLLRRAILSGAALAQFADERRILARLRHPHIGQMFDGGVTGDGTPYIIMELIAGEPITDWIARERLPLLRRLDLFCETADAVAHAHGNLIVHADIKPGNVIVEDGFGVKLLDFGIARLLDDTTEAKRAAFTPAYASPARLEGQPPTPADDIFACGILLRDLIAGDGDADLLAIAAKAAAPDPQARYGSIAELIGDIGRWREHRPVGARTPTRADALRLFWRRNRLGVSVATIVSACVLATLAATTILWLRAERARAAAEQRFAETRAMANYMLTDVDPGLARLPGSLPLRRAVVAKGRAYLQGLEQDRTADPALTMDIAAGYIDLARIYGLEVSGGLGDMAAAYRSLDRANALIRSAAARDAQDPRLLRLTGEAALTDANALFVEPDRTKFGHVLAQLQTARAAFTRYLQAEPDDLDARLELWRAQVMAGRVYTYQDQGDRGRAEIEPTLRNATLPVRTRVQAAERDFVLNGAYLMLAESYTDSDPARSYSYYAALARNVSRMQAAGMSDQKNDYIQSTAFSGMGQEDEAMKRYPAAVANLTQSIARLDRILAAGPNDDIARQRTYDQIVLADASAHVRDFARARALLDEAIRQERAQAAQGRPDAQRLLAIALQNRGSVEHTAGRPRQACEADRAAAAQWQAVRATHHGMAMDERKGGTLDRLREALSHCA